MLSLFIGLGNSRSNKFFQGLPSHVANRNVVDAQGSVDLKRSGSSLRRRVRSGQRRSRDRQQQQDRTDGGQVIDIDDDDEDNEMAQSGTYKAMAAPMATKRSVR